MKKLRREHIVRKKRINADAIPVINILLVLLIICIISTPIILGGVKLELPRGESEIILVDKEPIVISIKNDETIYIGKQAVKIKSLSKKLLEITNNNFDIKILVSADKTLSYEKIINIISVINSIGFSDVLLVMDLTKDL